MLERAAVLPWGAGCDRARRLGITRRRIIGVHSGFSHSSDLDPRKRVIAVLQDLVPSRPGPDGALVPCDTIENATLLCTAREGTGGESFPLH